MGRVAAASFGKAAGLLGYAHETEQGPYRRASGAQIGEPRNNHAQTAATDADPAFAPSPQARTPEQHAALVAKNMRHIWARKGGDEALAKSEGDPRLAG